MKKMENRRGAKIEKLKKQKIREEHGEEAAPKGVTRTIESMRVKDETIITDAEDDEIKGESLNEDEERDEDDSEEEESDDEKDGTGNPSKKHKTFRIKPDPKYNGNYYYHLKCHYHL